MRVLVGTSGYAYREWKPSFYPADLPASAFLRYYAERFPTVEINHTFYRMPTKATLSRWPKETPHGFVFALKASQRITHQKRLRDAAEPTAHLYDTLAALGPTRGPVLFQLPPNLKVDVPRLCDFLALLPDGHRAAFEFRHESWFCDDVYETLRSRGAALCVAQSESLSTPFVVTAPFGYLRLRELDYDDDALRAVRDRILAQPWNEVFVYFKHEEQGRGPRLAARLITLFGEVSRS